MIATRDIEPLLFDRNLPPELRRSSSASPDDEVETACRLCGSVASRIQDECICPDLLRWNMVLPAFAEPFPLVPQRR